MNDAIDRCPPPDDLAALLFESHSQPATVTAHLEQCELCRDQLRRWRMVRGTLDEWTVESPRPVRPTPRLRAPVGWLVTAALLLTVGLAAGIAIERGRQNEQLQLTVQSAVQTAVNEALQQANAADRPVGTQSPSPQSNENEEFQRLRRDADLLLTWASDFDRAAADRDELFRDAISVLDERQFHLRRDLTTLTQNADSDITHLMSMVHREDTE